MYTCEALKNTRLIMKMIDCFWVRIEGQMRYSESVEW